jgi:rhodanese-related sulfurtransferase
VALELEKLGYSKVYVLEGGWRAWEEKGYPMVSKELT